jgi:uncharacterized membrane protein YdjX (TVP38/TMEM64 family)
MIYKTIFASVVVVAIAFGVYAAGDWSWDLARLEQWIQQHTVLGAFVYVGIFIVSTLLPVTSLPLLPLAARAYGVPMTFVLSALGWWLGCVIAFEIGRRGRPYLQRFASAKTLSRCEALIAKKHTFWTVVVLRTLFPGDFVGFALGLLRYVGFWTFALASFIGTLPSAIIASYAGGEFGHGRYGAAIAATVATVVLMYVVRRMWEARAGASQTR